MHLIFTRQKYINVNLIFFAERILTHYKENGRKFISSGLKVFVNIITVIYIFTVIT